MSRARISIVCRPERKTRILELAKANNLSLQEYVLQASLGELKPPDTAQRLDDHLARIEALEAAIYGA